MVYIHTVDQMVYIYTMHQSGGDGGPPPAEAVVTALHCIELSSTYQSLQ